MWKTLTMTGASLLTSSIIINRAVDTTYNNFVIEGRGKIAGFCVSSAINMFDSTISYTSNPVSERVTFKNIYFQSNNAALAAYVMTQKFLRVVFDHSNFLQIKIVNSSNYLQSWRISGGYARSWSGTLVTAATFGYDIRTNDVDYEGGGSGFNFGTCNGCAAINNTFEGGNKFWYQSGGGGLTFIGNYLEGNVGIDLTLSAGGGAAYGVVIKGNFFSPGVTWPIVLGNTTGTGGGNYSTTNLYYDTGTTVGSFTDLGSFAASSLNSSGNLISVLPTALLTRGDVTPYAGGGQANATLLPYLS